MTKIANIEGIGGVYAAKLESADVHTMEQLLDKGQKPAGRKAIAETTGISSKLILK